jgi:hypothetical protein
MTLAEYSLAAFALLNCGRAVAYVPQMVRVYRDPHGAAAVSLITWALFAAANVATVCYAIAVSDDRLVAAVFALNAAGCFAIVALTALKRMRASRQSRFGARIASLRHSAHVVTLNADAMRDDGQRCDSPSTPVRDEMIRQGLFG